MGLLSRTRTAKHPPPLINPSYPSLKKKWSNLMAIFALLVIVCEIAFLGRLDMAKNVDLVHSWADSFHRPSSPSPGGGGGGGGLGPRRDTVNDGMDFLYGCESWLEKEDAVVYSRDFEKEPILVSSATAEEWSACSVGCKFGIVPSRKHDAGIGLPQQQGMNRVLRSMESSHYYPENNIDNARRKGYDVIMTTSLSSDVPVGYFSWTEYDIMAPVEPKTESALAAAFISNCGAWNFRLQALEVLEKSGITIDSYGSCHRNRDGNVDKVKTLKRYKFSLAFENSNEEDYVTEKYFQSLVSGTIPIVIGAPNIQDFAPSPDALLHIREPRDVNSVVKAMKYLAENPDAYNHSMRWKFEGPSDSFKALVDMAAVHSSCRLCIYLATKIREKEEASPGLKKRSCKCTRGTGTVYHVYVRERGRFNMESIFLRSHDLTLDALKSAVLRKFNQLNHVPVWKRERPEGLRGGNELRVYRIYPLGLTQRQALYTFNFKGDAEFKRHIEMHPCTKFEVIFV